ncbi:hypothetical protein Q5M85_21225 [Paraclostridium bifermentans]|nr:hypothetical protein [Paraclostridium bifermentans]
MERVDRDLEVGANKLFLNYNNDFGNGVEIGGRLTNKGNEVISNLGLIILKLDITFFRVV